MKRPGLVVLRDASADPSILPAAWAVGSLFDGTRHSYPVRSWGDAYDELETHRQEHGDILELHLWSHGTRGAPLIDRRAPDLRDLADAVGDRIQRVWWRSCDVHRDHDFAFEVTEHLGADSVGHCAVISAPLPWQQRAICALRVGEAPWWDPSGEGLRSCSALRMSIPEFAYKGRQ